MIDLALFEGHTLGPWEAVEASDHHGWYVTTDYGTTICDLYAMSNPGEASVRNGGRSKPVGFMHEMDGPNARLIAAAPELLNEVMRLRNIIDNILYNSSDYASTVQSTDVYIPTVWQNTTAIQDNNNE